MSLVHGDAVLSNTEMFSDVPEQVHLYEGKCSCAEDNLRRCSNFDKLAEALGLAKGIKLSKGLF